jgi:RNA polymerase sigma factor (sigma-70 family)
MIHIGIIDDHEIFREGVVSLLSRNTKFEIKFSIGDYTELTDELLQSISVLILDLSLQTLDGLSIMQLIKPKVPELKIIILSRHDSQVYMQKVKNAGADLFVSKSNAFNLLSESIESIYDPSTKRNLPLPEKEQGTIHEALAKLSKREKEVFLLLGEGKTLKEISYLINISPNTVSTYKSRIFFKLDIENHTQLLKLYYLSNT